MEGTRHRLTVAVEVAEPARAALDRAVATLRSRQPGLRWLDADAWHIELASLGGVTDEDADKIDQAVAEVAEAHPPFALRLDGGAGTVRSRLLYAGVEDSSDLNRLRAALIERMTAAGFEVDRLDFLAHTTLVRAPTGARLPPGLLGVFSGPAVTWTVRRLVVLRSRLRLGGTSYVVRSGHPLAGEVG